ncbi:protein tyrosine phosphatase [Segniliparus rotundus DSM 44985]|uniref:protein-tyrosine-phosphatase n=1 Tax=Segniliparus rotundus (strain ATCC BAA-972 / CDC 1076 / CIP 108378 / DSM 44985 / JCM 13578) TaxID=640132 RepID=D6ZA04_SEGRD|nr:low molecular weight protein-tyrosine-phosphatase [Segniliparus rotundus]ADG98674.1 protein tyrosine phosphatase [Segniliparus rotundus DSM 44985]
MDSSKLHVTFVCTGNICRSPMGEQMLRTQLEKLPWGSRVRVSSAGTSRWEIGNPIDERAAATLAEHNCPPFREHVAKTLDADHLAADLVLALAEDHRADLAQRGVPPERLRLLRSFDPDADGTEVADPYYGSASGFETTYRQIEASLPGVIAWLQTRLA